MALGNRIEWRIWCSIGDKVFPNGHSQMLPLQRSKPKKSTKSRHKTTNKMLFLFILGAKLLKILDMCKNCCIFARFLIKL